MAEIPGSRLRAWSTELVAWKLSRSRVNDPLRYFIYVSDAKLEMLFDQIPPKLRQRLSAEAKVDLKLASLTIKEAGQPAPTRMAKLKVVDRYIDRNQRVGTVEEPGKQFFRGKMPLRWGWLRDGYSDDPPWHGLHVAFFRGEHDGHIIILVGSRRHVLGEQPSAANTHVEPGSTSYSAVPNIISVISQHVTDMHVASGYYNGLREKARRAEVIDGSDTGDHAAAYPAWATNDEAAIFQPAEIALEACAELPLVGPPQWMEFLAVPLVEAQLPVSGGPNLPKGHAVLATPIYIGHADPE